MDTSEDLTQTTSALPSFFSGTIAATSSPKEKELKKKKESNKKNRREKPDVAYEEMMAKNRALYEEGVSAAREAFTDLRVQAAPVMDADYDTFDTNAESPVDIFEVVEWKCAELEATTASFHGAQCSSTFVVPLQPSSSACRPPPMTPSLCPSSHSEAKTMTETLNQTPMLLLPSSNGKVKIIQASKFLEASDLDETLKPETAEQLQYLQSFINTVCSAKSTQK